MLHRMHGLESSVLKLSAWMREICHQVVLCMTCIPSLYANSRTLVLRAGCYRNPVETGKDQDHRPEKRLERVLGAG